MSEGLSEGRGSERQVPFYCPYCGEEDLVPGGPDGGTWACQSCARSFALRFVGLTTTGRGAR